MATRADHPTTGAAPDPATAGRRPAGRPPRGDAVGEGTRGSGPYWLPLLLAAGVGCPVVLLVGALSGALEPVLLADSGPVVRFGLPLVRVLHDLLAALTVGALLLAAFLVPEARTTDRRGTAARVATAAGAGWVATAGVGAVLGFADIAGLAPSAPGFWEQLAVNAWPLEATRLWFTEAGLALVATGMAAVARTRAGLAWTLAAALVALAPLGFAGHASGTEGHHQAMTGMFLHLVGVTLWVGGLLALLVLRPVLGRALPVTVSRYSTVALGCYALVALSGVVVAVLQADDLSDLTSGYWWVLWAKVAALVVLGGFGSWHRRHLLADGLARRGAFARLALVEVAVMAATVGLAVALSRTPTPALESTVGDDPMFNLTGYRTPPPFQPSRLLTEWEVEWLFGPLAVVAVATYLVWQHRLRRRGDRWPVGRTVCWVLGWAVFGYVTNGAPGVYGRTTFSMHMVQHMTLMMIVPLLLVPAMPVTLALRALPRRRDRTLGPRELLLAVVHSRWARFIGNPLVAGLVFFGSLVAFYWTDLFGWALASHLGHVLMVAHFSLAGYAFVWSLIGRDPGPVRWPAPLRLCVLLGTIAAHAFFGLAMMQGTWLLAPGYFKTIAVPWVPDLLADQQLAGSIAWGVGELPTMVLALLVTLDWLRTDTREARRYDRRAERDDDAELAAYNAHLQRLAGTRQSGPGDPDGPVEAANRSDTQEER